MKTNTPLPTRPERWKWMTGSAAAAGAAMASSAEAGTVQITIGETASNVSGGLPTSNIGPDLTGDGKADIAGLVAFGYKLTGLSTSYQLRLDTATGYIATARWVYTSSSSSYFNVFIRSVGTFGPTAQNRSGLVPVTFTDKRINGGVLTNGWLEVNARNLSTTNHSISLVRLVFDDASTARPGGVAVGNPETEWVDPTIAQRRALLRKIRKATIKFKKAARRGQVAKARKFKKLIKKLKKQLKNLC